MGIADEIRKNYKPNPEPSKKSPSEVARTLFTDAVKRLKNNARNGLTEDRIIGNFISKKVKVVSCTYWIHQANSNTLSISYGYKEYSGDPVIVSGINAQKESEVREVMSALKQLCNNEGINVERYAGLHESEKNHIRFWIQI